MWRHLAAYAFAAALPGCATVSNGEKAVTGLGGILFSNLKFPVIYKRHDSTGFGSAFESTAYRRLLEAQPVDCRTGSKLFAGDPSVDQFSEFDCDDQAQDTLVVVSISGGGSRAGIFAAHVMAQLERKYDEIRGCAGPAPTPLPECKAASFARRIHAFSTVSGGSLYTYFVLRQLKDDAWEPGPELFREVSSRRWHAMEKVGRWAFWSYIRGDTFYGDSVVSLGPVTWGFDFFSDTSYRNYLARALEFGGYFEPIDVRKWPKRFATSHNPFARQRIRFRDVGGNGPLPRFYFNATMLESGAPFVFTQRLTNLRPVRIPHRTARPDLPDVGCEGTAADGEESVEDCRRNWLRRPLRHSFTPEDLGNDPAEMAASDAAVASAAFPFAVDPVKLRRFELRDDGTVAATDQFVSLADGGVFDNSGLTTTVDLYDYLQQYRKVKHLIIIAINADGGRYQENVADDAATIEGPSVLGVGIPLPTLFTGADSLNVIHYSNKRRAEIIAWNEFAKIAARADTRIEVASQKLNAIVQNKQPVSTAAPELSQLQPESRRELESMVTQAQSVNPMISGPAVADAYRRARASQQLVHYFPIDLSQLSSDDPHRIPGGQSNFDATTRLATTFWTYAGDDFVLEKAAERIVTTEQDTAWPVGPTCRRDIRRLDEAVAFSLLRSASGRWKETDATCTPPAPPS